ncbi:MAG: DUF4199 domain-containing protein [Prevotella sp.]|nr:DUF4199 domain-containing protein [Prevotella sp.]
MTPAEYIQLKAFARIDGALLAVVWIIGFACYLVGMARPVYGLAAVLLLVSSPFFAASRLRHFRDEARQGSITLARGWAYSVLMFFYGGILLALAQCLYLTFMDHGYMVMQLTRMMESPEGKMVVEQYGLQQTMAESLAMLSEQRPIDLALNMLTMVILSGIVLGLPIGAFMQRKGCKEVKGNKGVKDSGHINSNTSL